MSAAFEGLRVCLVGPVPPPSGGMANQTRQLAELLRAEGASVDLVKVNAPYRPRWVAHVRVLRALFRLVPYVLCLWRSAKGAHVIHVIANSGWAWHLCAAPAIWAGSLRGVPIVLNYRGGGAAEFFRHSMTWIRPTLVRCSAIVVPSQFLERIFREYGFRAHVVPNVVNLARFAPAEGRGLSDAPFPAAPHLLVARNLEPIYDVETALRAFRIIREIMPAAWISVAGSGPARAALEALSKELGIDGAVVFTGGLDNEAMAALYRRADLVLNPSLADNMPISILEALASGVAVVSSCVGGVPDLVTHGTTAVLVPPRDPQAMARAALDLLEDPDRRRAQIRAGLDHVRQFTWAHVRHRLRAIYDEVLRRSALPGPSGAPVR